MQVQREDMWWKWEQFSDTPVSAFSEHNGLMDCDQMAGRCTRTGIKSTIIGADLKDEGLSRPSGI